jgi:hypothetical protein
MLLAQAVPAGDVDFLGGMVTSMETAGHRFETASFQLGLSLFAVLSLAGCAMFFWAYWNEHHSLHGIENGIFAMVKGIGVPLTIMMSVGLALPQLAAIAMALSGDITGVVITGPTGILLLGVTQAVKLVQQPYSMVLAAVPPPSNVGGAAGMLGLNVVPGALALAQNSGHLLTAAIATIIAALVAIFIVLPCFAIITLEYIVAMANIAIVLSVGAFQMGWSATPGTSSMASRFYGAVNAAVMRLVVITVFASFVGATVGLWGATLAAPAHGNVNLLALAVAWFKLAAGSIVLAGLALKLPNLASEAMGGPPSAGGMDAVGVAAKGGQVAAKIAGGVGGKNGSSVGSIHRG